MFDCQVAILSTLIEKARFYGTLGLGGSVGRKGFSLIELLVAVVILGIISLAISSSIVGMQKSSQSLTNKIATLDLQLLLSRYFSSSSFCSCFLKGLTFNTDSAKLSGTPSFIPTSFGPTCTPSADKLAEEGMELNGPQLKIDKIELADFVNLGSNILSKLHVSFFSASSVAPKPIETNLDFSIDLSAGSSSARPIIGCGQTGPAGQAWECSIMGNNLSDANCTVDIPLTSNRLAVIVSGKSSNPWGGKGVDIDLFVDAGSTNLEKGGNSIVKGHSASLGLNTIVDGSHSGKTFRLRFKSSPYSDPNVRMLIFEVK